MYVQYTVFVMMSCCWCEQVHTLCYYTQLQLQLCAYVCLYTMYMQVAKQLPVWVYMYLHVTLQVYKDMHALTPGSKIAYGAPPSHKYNLTVYCRRLSENR